MKPKDIVVSATRQAQKDKYTGFLSCSGSGLLNPHSQGVEWWVARAGDREEGGDASHGENFPFHSGESDLEVG